MNEYIAYLILGNLYLHDIAYVYVYIVELIKYTTCCETSLVFEYSLWRIGNFNENEKEKKKKNNFVYAEEL